MIDIIHIVGNRPQFIKLAVLYKELATEKTISQKIIHTGQHSSAQMSDIFFRELEIPVPDLMLEPAPGSNTDQFIAVVSHSLQQYFLNHKTSIVFVYGDTNTTLAASLAAKRIGLTLVHFEAGVRTEDGTMPEEINRIITDRLADINYCCTNRNYHRMISEGYGAAIPGRVVETGDLMYDAFLKIEPSPENIIEATHYVACTIHRAANILSKENLTGIIEGLNAIHETIPVFMPVHPHTQKRIEEYGLRPAFLMFPSIGYPEMKRFIMQSTFVITDSGGTAREAYFCKKRSIVVMEKPFWPEIINEGCSVQSSPLSRSLMNQFSKLSTLDPNFQTPIFGNGHAAKNIREDLVKNLS